MKTPIIHFLVLLLTLSAADSVLADNTSLYDTTGWRYGNSNAGHKTSSMVYAMPTTNPYGRRITRLGGQHMGRLLGHQKSLVSSSVSALKASSGFHLLYSQIAVAGQTVALDVKTSSGILPRSLETSYNRWHFLPSVRRQLWGIVQLRANSILHIDRNATAEVEGGQPGVSVNTSIRRYGVFEAFQLRGARRERILAQVVGLFDGHRKGDIATTLTTTGYRGTDAHRLQPQSVNLSVRIPRCLTPARTFRPLSNPGHLLIARWRFPGVHQVREYGLQD